jgi:deazaflavin-dependent oxidoreductase (nitroreductase family)
MPLPSEEAAGNASTIADFREHGGRITKGRLAGSRLLLLTTQGATSRQSQTTPVGYTLDGRRYVVVGSNSGGPKDPAWATNVRANPVVTVEVGDERFTARASILEGTERRRLLDAHIAAIPIFARYETMTDRPLPVVAIERLD